MLLLSMRMSIYECRARIAAPRAAGGAPPAAEPARPAGSPGPGRGCWGTAPGLLPSPAAGRAPELRCSAVLQPFCPRGGFPNFTSHKNPRGSHEPSHGGHPLTPFPEERRGAPPAPLRRGAPIALPQMGGGASPLHLPPVPPGRALSRPLSSGWRGPSPPPHETTGQPHRPRSSGEAFPRPSPPGIPGVGTRPSPNRATSDPFPRGCSAPSHLPRVPSVPRGVPLSPSRAVAVLTSRSRERRSEAERAARSGAGAALSSFPFKRGHRPACVCGTGRVLRPLLL